METSFERALDGFGIDRNKWSRLEGGLLRAFQRRAHHHLPDVPAEENWLEWLALMRHHGGPTRLLDWTYSYYIAIFFALESVVTKKKRERTNPAAVWALDAKWLGDQIRERKLLPPAHHQMFDVDKNMEVPGTFENVLARMPHDRKRYVFALNAFRQNERQAVQQGVFAAGADVSATFEENLAAMFEGLTRPRRELVKIKINFSDKELNEAVVTLLRMNITTASLYPGIDGYARSLALVLARSEILDPDKDFPSYDA